ncbi:rhomboid family intramembrane serine protease [Paracoccus sediminicola]|uniref:rhomboid family intramembrane serine protease n=1 Tax=Paracoccus sediminicola TaxID=3017783 RepID=UPI0022F0F330|nr:rhomboid family intramembrane serine protease [Paracoccus sediminicola]WBU58425.1 rhomboid family intramembrane serine protease [Paracoccus sediminicola]
MFPIRDHNPSERTPYVTIALIAINIVMFLLTASWAGGMVRLWEDLALYPVAVTNGANLWGLVSHMFLHAGIFHIAGNMLFLWVFGDNLEDQMGHLGFLLFYLACGLAAAGAQIAANPSEGIPMVGASGAVAGVMGGYLLLFPKARVDVLAIIIIFIKVFTIPAWVMLGLWFLFQIFGSFSLMGSDGVAYWAHAGGFLAGIVLTAPLFLRRGATGFWDRTEGHPPHPEAKYPRSRIPQVRR